MGFHKLRLFRDLLCFFAKSAILRFRQVKVKFVYVELAGGDSIVKIKAIECGRRMKWSTQLLAKHIPSKYG